MTSRESVVTGEIAKLLVQRVLSLGVFAAHVGLHDSVAKRPQVHQLDGCPRDRDPPIRRGGACAASTVKADSNVGAAGDDKVRHRVAHNLVGLGEVRY